MSDAVALGASGEPDGGVRLRSDGAAFAVAVALGAGALMKNDGL